LNLPVKPAAARAVVAGENLKLQPGADGGVEVTLGRVPVHEVVCFELA